MTVDNEYDEQFHGGVVLLMNIDFRGMLRLAGEVGYIQRLLKQRDTVLPLNWQKLRTVFESSVIECQAVADHVAQGNRLPSLLQ